MAISLSLSGAARRQLYYYIALRCFNQQKALKQLRKGRVFDLLPPV